MKLFISFLLVFLQVFTPTAYAGTKTIVKSDILEGNVADIDILGSNGHFERNAIGWAAYDDAAADPVDATGGTSTTTCARSTSSPIDGDGSLLMTKTGGASYQGEGCALTFTVPANLSGEPLQISFEYAVASGTYADDAVELWLYNSTGTTLIQPAPTLLKNHSLNRQTYKAEFQPTYSTSAQTFRLALHIGATDTTAYTLKFDNFRLYKGRKSYGSPITDVTTYTPTTTNIGTATFSTLTGYWRRVGDKAEISIVAIASGAGSGASAFTFSLPSGLVADSSKYGSGLTIGEATHYSLEAATQYDTSGVGLASTTTINITNNGAGGSFTGADIRADTQIYIKVLIPIVGWSSSVVMSQDASTRVVSLTAYRSSPNLTITAGTPLEVIINTIETDGDTHGSLDTTTGRFTAKVPGWYRFSANAILTMGATAAGQIELFVKKNGSSAKLYGYYVLDSLANSKNYSVFITDKVYLNAGDYISLWATSTSQNVTFQSNSSSHVSSISIERISGPSQIAASESVVASYFLTSNLTINTSVTDITGWTKYVDSHNGMNTTTGVYTFQVSGTYELNGNLRFDTGGSAATQHIITTAGSIVSTLGATSDLAASKAYMYYPNLTFRALAGDTIKLQGQSLTNSSTAIGSQNFISIKRVGNY